MSVEDHLIRLFQRRAGDGPTDLIRLCLFDWIACAEAGLGEDVAEIVKAQVADKGSSARVGGGRTTASQAALINGTIGHALDYDDTHFDHIGHTSAVIMPAVLAVADHLGSHDAKRILDAALIGSEAAVRTGLWLGRDHYQIGFHQTATAGAIGAALGCGRLLQLDDVQTRHALGLVATIASGLKGQFGTMGKPLNAGLAARAGVEAALWAQAGMTSDSGGVQQFGATHHGQNNLDAFEDAEPWKIARISHKFHACCHGLHAALEALRDVTGEVAALTIHTHPRWMSVCNKPAPTSGLEAKFSYRMVCAMALGGVDTAVIANFSDATANDPALVALRDRVHVQDDETLSEMQARVDVAYVDGSSDTLHHDLNAPIDLATREKRLRAKAAGLLGARADDVWAAVNAPDYANLLLA